MNTVKLFLIDDDDDDRELFEYALKSVNSEVEFTYATSARDALAKLKLSEQLPHYIFLDLNMPGMDGMECLEALKKLDAIKGVPVVIYSALSSPFYEELARKLEATHYLVKPFRSGDLTEIIDELLTGENLPFLLPLKVGRF